MYWLYRSRLSGSSGSRAQTVDALFIPIFAAVMTSRMPLYVMLMSSFVGLTSLYGCGNCDGDAIRQCLDDNAASGTTAPGRMLGDDYSDISLILAKGHVEFAMQQVEELKARFEAEEAEGRSLSDLSAQCEAMQEQIDCYKGKCDCTCEDMFDTEEDVKTGCGDKPETKVSEMSKLIADMAKILCTGDKEVKDPCA